MHGLVSLKAGNGKYEKITQLSCYEPGEDHKVNKITERANEQGFRNKVECSEVLQHLQLFIVHHRSSRIKLSCVSKLCAWKVLMISRKPGVEKMYDH